MFRIWMATAVFAATLGLGEVASAQQPFGFDIDAHPESYDSCKEMMKPVYRCTTAPQPHPDIGFYLIHYAEGVGVCNIQGLSETIEDTEDGSRTKRATDKMRDEISKQYGNYTSSSAKLGWPPASDNWLEEIRTETRRYFYLWTQQLTPEAFGDVGMVIVSAHATTSRMGFVIAEFRTKYRQRCKKKRLLNGSIVHSKSCRASRRRN